MARQIGELIGASGMLIVGVGYLTMILLVCWLPFMAWSVTRNIKQIRMQLERLNEILDSKMTIT